MEHYLQYKYGLKSSENFDEYLKFIGVGLLARTAAAGVSPVCSLVLNEDGTYTFTSYSLLKTITLTFSLDEEFIEERPADGAQLKSKCTIVGNDLIHESTEESGRKTRVVRTFTENSLMAVTTVDGWDKQCIRVYERIY
ncbi:probable fatty acid-binding protein [Achroia grisella]|uniref:probable fatty acid-binding protein n=1 Tax=Achroia grisella TaxID=688607 RepID=UPI0027D2196E|nr:probable fatty acid-binding protein [Achroia grisella]